MSLSLELTRQQAFQLFAAGKIPQAVELGLLAIRQNKNDAQTLMMLSLSAGMSGDYARAETYMNRCLTLLPRDPMVRVEAGKLQYSRGRLDQALACVNKALQLQPGYLPAIAHKAEILERRGDYAGARDLLQPLVDQQAENGAMAVIFSRVLLESGQPEQAVAYASRHVADPRTDVQERRHLHIVAAKAFDKMGQYDRAFESYRSSHEALGVKFDATAHIAHFDALIDLFSAKNLARLPRAVNRSSLPVFIASMPRTGSTLVEQILHAHPKGYGAGEITNLSQIILGLSELTGTLVPYPECVLDLDQKQVNRLSENYLRDIQTMGGRASRVINKQLDNHLHLGMIQMLFPGARVIHVLRDPVDTCFACYTATLSPVNHPYAGDLESLGLAYRQYLRLMRHWHESLDLPILDVAYEDLVAEPDRWVRRIVDFCGLEWDDACLRSHEADRDVMTISYDQIRKPIYRSSVRRSDRYARFLEPLKASLAGPGQ